MKKLILILSFVLAFSSANAQSIFPELEPAFKQIINRHTTTDPDLEHPNELTKKSLNPLAIVSKPRTHQFYRWQNGAWVSIQNYQYGYNTDAQIVRTHIINGATLDTISTDTVVFTTLPDNRKQKITLNRRKTNGIWANRRRTIVVIDSNAVQWLYEIYLWSNSINTWFASDKRETNYRNSYRTFSTQENRQCNGANCNTFKATSVFDSLNRVTQINNLYFTATTNTIDTLLSKQTYNGNSMCPNLTEDFNITNGRATTENRQRIFNFFRCDSSGIRLYDLGLIMPQTASLIRFNNPGTDSLHYSYTYLSPNLNYQDVILETKTFRINASTPWERSRQTFETKWNGGYDYILEFWNFITNEYELALRQTAKYDADNNLTDKGVFDWSPGTAMWDTSNYEKINYIYNGINLIESVSRNRQGFGTTLSNSTRSVYSNHQTFNLPTQITEQKTTQNQLKIYPNPAKNSINVEVKNAVSIEIADVLGKIVLSKNTSTDNQIDVSSLEQGVYFVKIINLKNETFVEKFMKE